jgi:hypothetical protein
MFLYIYLVLFSTAGDRENLAAQHFNEVVQIFKAQQYSSIGVLSCPFELVSLLKLLYKKLHLEFEKTKIRFTLFLHLELGWGSSCCQSPSGTLGVP